MSNLLDSEGGPPDPILFLRKVALDQSTHGMDASMLAKMDSEDGGAPPPLPRKQDPPARERPSNGAPWPYRDNLSFTRSLIFYGEGKQSLQNHETCFAPSDMNLQRQGDSINPQTLTFASYHHRSRD